MSNEIYNCARCLKDYNANAYPPVLIDEERYCEDCAVYLDETAEAKAEGNRDAWLYLKSQWT